MFVLKPLLIDNTVYMVYGLLIGQAPSWQSLVSPFNWSPIERRQSQNKVFLKRILLQLLPFLLHWAANRVLGLVAKAAERGITAQCRIATAQNKLCSRIPIVHIP